MVFCLDKREEEGAVSEELVNRRSMRWDGLWRHSPKKLSQGETHYSRILQRNRWVTGRLIVREENRCKRVERHQRESAVIACFSKTNRWEGRIVVWIVYSWRQLSQKAISHVENSGLGLQNKCWLKRGRFVLLARLVSYSRRCCRPRADW